MITTTPKKSLSAPDLLFTRKVLLSLTVLIIVIYVALLIPLTLYSRFSGAAYSAVYNIIEISLFFGCQKYNWPCTLAFRILFVLHDIGYFITYAMFAADYYSVSQYNYNKQYYERSCDDYTKRCERYDDDYYSNSTDNDHYCYYKDYYCKLAAAGPFTLASTVFFLLSFGIGIAILVTYSKFPKYGGSCCQPRQPQVMMMMTNGQVVPMEAFATTSGGMNQQLHVVQNMNEVNGPISPTSQQPSQTVIQPAAVQQTVPSPVEIPPAYNTLKT